jgi:FixJ family two-component response regulator
VHALAFRLNPAITADAPARRPACLVLHIDLGMFGLQLQRELNARGSTVPVVVMTAFDEASATRRTKTDAPAISIKSRTSTSCWS